MSETTKRAVVNVAPRPNYTGYYSAGEYWPNGSTAIEVVADDAAKKAGEAAAKKAGEARRFITEKQLTDLRAEKHLLSVMTPDEAAAQAGPGAMVLSDEERALVEKHRAEKAKAAKPNTPSK